MSRESPRTRVLMVLEAGFPVLGGGGSESQVHTLALRLRARGHQVTVLTPRFSYAPQARVERYRGLLICRIGYPRIRLLGSLVLWLRLVAFLRGHGRRYDAWHVHIAHYVGAVTCAVGHAIGKPVVVKVSGWWELRKGLLKPGRSMIGAIGKRWLRRANVMQAISHRIETELAQHGFAQQRVVALPNAIDTTRFAARPLPRDDARPLRVIYVGRLVPEKGLETLFDAWQHAFPAAGVATLSLIGTGDSENALRARIAQLGIADQIEFLGHRDDVAAVLQDADFGVLPSTIEGLSNTLLELMACCVPVIASEVSGSEDFVVEGRNGWLFPVGDSARLAQHLTAAARLGRAQLHALGCQARADVAARAGVDVVVDRLLALYRGADPARLDTAPAFAASLPGR